MHSRKVAVFLTFILPVGLVALLLALLSTVRSGAEAAVANFAGLLPFGWAFAAGTVASVNPCGFFMLPAYLSYQLGVKDTGFQASSAFRKTLRAVSLGMVATAGFLLVMALIGVITAVGSQRLIKVFPYTGVTIGVALAGLGIWMLVTHRTIGVLAASRIAVTPQRTPRNVFLFGIAYAAGSLSCTLPIFLLVVGTSLASRGLAASFGQFLSFGLGMGMILVAVTVGAAFFQDAVARTLRASIPYVHRISAFFLVGAGLYLVYYWVFSSGSIL